MVAASLPHQAWLWDHPRWLPWLHVCSSSTGLHREEVLRTLSRMSICIWEGKLTTLEVVIQEDLLHCTKINGRELAHWDTWLHGT